MARIIIYVKWNGNRTKPGLMLRDNDNPNNKDDHLTTLVSPGDMVTWELDKDSGLSSLDDIIRYDDPESRVASKDLLASWADGNTPESITANIKSISPGKGTIEFYKIGFQLPGDNTLYWDDPKLKMNI